MQIHIQFPGPRIDNFPRLPKGRLFGRLRHDYELWGVSRPTHNEAQDKILGLPETIKTLYSVFVPMNREWQNFWADGLSLAKFNKLFYQLPSEESDYIKSAFKSITYGGRALTNGHGWNDGYCDFINGVNLDKPPMQQETINFGGNVIELLGTDPVRLGGADVYRVRTFNAYDEPPDILKFNYLTMPWLVMQLTNSRRTKILRPDGTWDGESWFETAIDPFPQLTGIPVPAPFLGKGIINYIRVERVQILNDEEIVPPVYE